ncbi:hypothetical protein CO038_01310 [Candidatus Pacearchaeota archaeon CG_4_9_14_0_2_um_filter_39_13]|nr:MAG: hypothetical protein CO038_01310 [Candidatus Pacearchaeota archaeon CG_4_9_14_0_2_um_filter_39_13]
METRTELFAFFGFALLLFVASLGFYLTKTVQTNPPISGQYELEDCKSLVYNEEASMNILFFSSEEEAVEYSSYLLQASPFNENPESFNFYYIGPDNYKPDCEIYKGAAVLCYDQEIIRKAASCPHDYIVVIDRQPLNIRSSAYLNVMSLNSRHSLTVFLHEFGHAGFNFAEEYKTDGRIPRGSENCKSSCEGFEGETDGCFQECSKDSYYRSIQNGVMRTLSTSDYGLFNSNLIREVIRSKKPVKGLTGAVVSEDNSCENQNYFLLKAQYLDGKIVVISKSIEPGCAPSSSNFESDFSYRVFAEDETLIFEDSRNLNIFTDVQQDGTEEIEGETYSVLEEGEIFFITSPYSESASKIEIIEETTGAETQETLQNLGGEVACHL